MKTIEDRITKAISDFQASNGYYPNLAELENFFGVTDALYIAFNDALLNLLMAKIVDINVDNKTYFLNVDKVESKRSEEPVLFSKGKW